MKNKKTAFTLIELLVTISIIAVLVVVTSISFTDVRKNSKDAKRINNIKQIQFALELYRRDIGTYPLSLSINSSLVNPSSSDIIYLKKIPSNPRPESNELCPETEYSYESNGQFYYLEFCLEKNEQEISSGYNCASMSGIATGTCPSL